MGLADSAACECGEPEQTADHIINSCLLHRPPSEAGLFEVGPLTRAWLQQTELTISYDDTRKKKKEEHNVPLAEKQHSYVVVKPRSPLINDPTGFFPRLPITLPVVCTVVIHDSSTLNIWAVFVDYCLQLVEILAICHFIEASRPYGRRRFCLT